MITIQKHLIKSNISLWLQTLIKIEREGNFNLIKYIYKKSYIKYHI